MPRVTANAMRIAFEEHGDPEGSAILLIHGLGMPLSGWPPALIADLVAAGYRVITFDNRDIGQSEHVSARPRLLWQFIRRKLGLRIRAPYLLDDMRDDAIGLLDALGVERAHVLGVSMGGMIAQLLALGATDRVLSLTSVMSTTGEPGLPGATPEVRRHLMSRPASSSVADRTAFSMRTWELIGSPDHADTEARLDLVRRIADRGVTAAGVARQFMAIAASEPRTQRLLRLNLPTLVIHGDRDPLVPLACGQHTADSIPGSRLVVMPGMGHDLPPFYLDQITRLLIDHMRESAASRAAA